jgi:hypothetical protein
VAVNTGLLRKSSWKIPNALEGTKAVKTVGTESEKKEVGAQMEVMRNGSTLQRRQMRLWRNSGCVNHRGGARGPRESLESVLEHLFRL